MGDWISNAKCSETCRHAISEMLATDNGIPAEEQSLLAVLAMVKGGGLDRYWTDSELFRCEGGNQLLAQSFEGILNKPNPTVILNSPVESIRPVGGRVSLTITGNKDPDLVDDVILAIPPSVWSTIKLNGFPELAAKLSNPPGLGRNVKCLLRFKKRFWRNSRVAPLCPRTARWI